MTERELAAKLHDITGSPVALTPDGLAEVEARAEAHPEDVRLDAAVLALHDALQVRTAPPVIGGVRRDRLVRWDRHTVTWVGTDTATKERTLVRALRPDAARDPVLRRWFRRQVRGLRPLLTPRLADGGDAAVVAVGGPVADPPRPSRPEAVRWWVGGLIAIQRWADAGRGLPALALEELRTTDHGIQVVCLTPGRQGVGPALASLTHHLGPPPESGPLGEMWSAARAAPPHTLEQAAEVLIPGLARVLAAERHHLHDQWHRGLHGRRTARLLRAVQGLDAAVPPPQGRGAVGVDLEGRITVVETRDRSVWWGPEDDLQPVYRPEQGFDAPLGRRLLRARAVAPPSAALQARTDGDLEAVETLCRWVAAGLRLRTVRLLLERAGP